MLNSMHTVDIQVLMRRNKNLNKPYSNSHYWLNSQVLIMSSCVEEKQYKK